MSQHKQFELMCALAAVGQLNSSELMQLRQHVEECVGCQVRLSEFAQISAQALIPFGEKRSDDYHVPRGMKARFVARARSEGITLQKPINFLSHKLFHPSEWRVNIAAAALLILAVIAGWISNHTHKIAFKPEQNATNEVSFETKPYESSSTSGRLKSRRVVRTAQRHFHPEKAKESLAWVDPSTITPAKLTSVSSRYSATSYQGKVPLDSSFFSRNAQIQTNELRISKMFASSEQPALTGPLLISVNLLPPAFLYNTEQPSPSGVRWAQLGGTQPGIDWSKIRVEILSGSSRWKRLPSFEFEVNAQ